MMSRHANFAAVVVAIADRIVVVADRSERNVAREANDLDSGSLENSNDFG